MESAPSLVLARELYTFSFGYYSKSKECLKVVRSYQTHFHNLHFKMMELKLTIDFTRPTLTIYILR